MKGIVDAPGIKLQSYLKRELKLTSRQISQAKFRKDGILVNGVRCRVSETVHPGDMVEVLLEDDEKGSDQLIPLQQELNILYEDEDILAVNKPAGLVVHPSHGHYQDSLANAVNYYFMSEGKNVKIRAVGRLDKETSGIVIFAKNQVAAARLAAQKEQGIFQKKYTALVQGRLEPAFGTITAPIARDGSTLMKMKVCDQGLRAVTHYQTKKSNGNCSLVELSIETGRTHQIRVHMAFAGPPLLGDSLYGNGGYSDNLHEDKLYGNGLHSDKPYGWESGKRRNMNCCVISRAALHAGLCMFRQPFTGQEICVEAALPGDMERFLQMYLL